MQENLVSDSGLNTPVREVRATTSKRDRIILATFIVGTLLQCWLVARITFNEERTVRHFKQPDSWHVLNVILAGVALVAMATVLRTGRWWQRFVALVLCICPVLFLYDLCRWCSAVLSQP